MAVFNINVTTDPFVGDSGSGGVQGVVPAPAAGDAAAAKYLHADGTWKAVAGGSVAQRTGSAIAFDSPAVYNDPLAPVSTAVALDLSGAVVGTEVVAYFNHSSEPTWPAGITAVGVWDNSQLNVVRFLYQSATEISAVILSNAVGSYVNPEVIKLVTASVATTGTTAVAIPDLSFTVLAGRTYNVDIMLGLRCDGTAPVGGAAFGVYLSEADADVALRGHISALVNTEMNYLYLVKPNAGYNSLRTTSPGFNVGSAPGMLRLSGLVIGGAVDSVCDIRFASVKSGRTSTVVAAGSFLKARLI
jgi:hypothetical protein